MLKNPPLLPLLWSDTSPHTPHFFVIHAVVQTFLPYGAGIADVLADSKVVVVVRCFQWRKEEVIVDALT